MERMEEEVDQSEYRAYQHFISNSNWDRAGLQRAVALDASKLLEIQKKIMVAQRYWVERTFDNTKNELAMSDYRVRKWKGWHNHHSLVMLASLFIMKQQIDNYSEVPLLSFRDARILVILQVFGTEKDVKIRLEQMQIRHQKRKSDIKRNYRKQSNNQSVLT